MKADKNIDPGTALGGRTQLARLSWSEENKEKEGTNVRRGRRRRDTGYKKIIS